MVNTKAFKIRMLELDIQQQDICEKLDIKPGTRRAKLSNERAFTLSEAEQMQEILRIPDCEFGYYFFNRMSRSATDSQ